MKTQTTQIVQCPTCGKRNRVPAAANGVPRCGNCHNALPWVVDADDESFAEVVDQSTVPVLVDIWAPWCGPCRTVSPALERLAVEFAGKLKLVKVNADEASGIARRFNAQSIPTLLVLKSGQEVERQIGAAPVARLRSWLEQTLAS